MTNTQLFIAVGVPVLVMIVGFVLQNRAFHGELNGLRSEMLARFDAVNGRIESNFNALNARIDGLEKRIDGVEKRISVIEADLRQFYSITGNHEGRISAFEKR